VNFNSGMVSVVIPSHVVNPWLRASIQSVVDQTYQNWQLIVALNNLGDDDVLLMKSDFSRDPRISIIDYGHGLTLAKVRARAISDCRGEFIAMLDSDDVCQSTRLEKQVDFLNRHLDCVAVGSQLSFIDGNGHPIQRDSKYRKRLSRESVPLESPIAQPAAMFRSDIYALAGGYSAEIEFGFEDYDLWLRMLRHGSICNLDERLTTYRIHSASMSQYHREKQLRGRISSLFRHLTGELIAFETFDDAQDLGRHLRRLSAYLRVKVLYSYLTQTRLLTRAVKIQFAFFALLGGQAA
jgi:glycosyltransferase involved in cell wall biosynthesis